MKTSLFKSLSSLLVAGALSAQLGGCGAEFSGEEEVDAGDTASVSDALVRPVPGKPAPPSTASTKPTKPVVTSPPTTTAPAAPPVVVSKPAAPSGGSATTGATDVERNFPWSVFITGGLGCRGTLIHPQWVLTAAHCLGTIAGTVKYIRKDASGTEVANESRRFDEAGENRGMYAHPGYVPGGENWGQPYNDIALIRLAKPFAIDDNIQTAALPRFYANPGEVGTIATNNHSNAPSGSTSIVRAPLLPTQSYVAPSGFIAISPPAASLCEGDSGSGFVALRDGRATVTGVVSNLSGSGECIAANKQLQLADVFAYRDWIYSTMMKSPEQVDGRVRVRWSGLASAAGTMSLECLSAPVTGTTFVPMNIPGSEISMDGCDRVRVTCLLEDKNRSLSAFTKRTFTAGGALTGTASLPILPKVTADLAEPGSSFLRYDCGVYDTTAVSAPITGGGSVSSKAL